MGISKIFKNILGSRNQRLLKGYSKNVEAINSLEKEISALSDEQLKAKTDKFRQQLRDSDDDVDAILVEAFAVVREAAVRTLNMRHFDVQLIGGMVLNDGKIAEMGTGEGKTLVATLPAYLNALSGKGVHIVTVNDYLAQRDADWMGPIYQFLGLSVGVNLSDMGHDDKKSALAADITYGTNNEFGFDYLRDNMAFTLQDKVQRELNFAIIDEVDSILIDEARTPLIISGSAEDSSELYIKINKIIPRLRMRQSEDGPGDYYLDEKNRQAYLTEEGHQRVEQILFQEGIIKHGESLYAPANISIMHHIYSALCAHGLYQRDVHYIVKNGEVVIVDEHTGRTLAGRRWAEGLHQAVEAKEGVKIQNENQTLASITFQNYFRLYSKLSGMTGTADTEAYEFQQIYGLEVVVVPTNLPIIRKDFGDQIYLTKKEKFNAIIKDIKTCREQQRPVLVGTASIEASEYLSSLLKNDGIKHNVLNAKYHQKEAEIIAEAGRPGAVTIATNMAGRGTDIVLGGNLEAELETLDKVTEIDIESHKKAWQVRHDQVIKAGGLHVIGSERHESRRIDNQLRGRCGRQGDPGSSRFYLALDDDLMRIFASERVAGIMRRLGMPEGGAIEHSIINRSIENAQRKVEGHNFDMRKELLEFDDVANSQRKVVYAQRSDIMAQDDVSKNIIAIRKDVIEETINLFIQPGTLEEQWDIPALEQKLSNDFKLNLPLSRWLEEDESLHEESLRERIFEELVKAYELKEEKVGGEVMRHFEKSILLQSLDSHWKDHLAAMDHLRQGIYLRGYAQRNPKQEYKREAFALFADMLGNLKHEVISILTTVEIEAEEDIDAMDEARRIAGMQQNMVFQHPSQKTVDLDNLPKAANEMANLASTVHESGQHESNKVVPFVRETPKVGRNEPCPCGSGKKYKHCHGKAD